MKELAARYGASYKTVHNALALLAGSGRAVRHGRRYRVYQPPRRGSTGTVVMVAGGGFIESRGGEARKAGQIVRHLESELNRLNVSCLLISFEDFTGSRRGRVGGLHDRITRRRSVLGYLVQMSTLPHVPLQRFRRLLHETGKPVAVLDETGYREREVDWQRYPRMRMFTVATSEQAGLDVGKQLYALGHRRIAYISPARHSSWCMNRCEGLVKALGRGNVHECATGRYWFDYALQEQQRGPPEEHQLRSETRARLLTAGSVYPPDYILPSPERYPAFKALLRQWLRPAFEEALSDSVATAWVTANDVVALAALGYLEDHGVAVPRDLSLASFDDSYQAFARDVTSYNFGLHALAEALLDHAVRGLAPSTRKTVVPAEAPGTVMVRQSTQPVGDTATRGAYYPFERGVILGTTQLG
jgi:DNA-binding LacI/PurR family transcriptional regulator